MRVVAAIMRVFFLQGSKRRRRTAERMLRRRWDREERSLCPCTIIWAGRPPRPCLIPRCYPMVAVVVTVWCTGRSHEWQRDAHTGAATCWMPGCPYVAVAMTLCWSIFFP
jgi:hypothetical protein